MDSNITPKFSFIPKGSLVRDESFFERRRPRSVMGIIAITAFLLSISAYAALYYYNTVLNADIAANTIEIRKAQKEFSDAPEVAEAKVFSARANLANQLLNAHAIASPVLAFLSKNTSESVLYDKFSFKNGLNGSTIELSGEAPTYAALAYQADVLRSKTKELSDFSVSNVSLTKFGTVTFSFAMTFAPDYLLYVKNLSDVPALVKTPKIVPSSLPADVSATSTVNSAGATSTKSVTNDWTLSPRALSTATTTSAPLAPPEKQSFLMSLWSRIKFW